MRKLPFVVALFALYLAVAPASAQSGGSDFRDALKLAQKQVPDGLLLLARREGGGVFGFYFYELRVTIEVEIQGGRVVKKEEIKPNKKDNLGDDVVQALAKYKGAKLPYPRYLEIAQEGGRRGDVNGIRVGLSGENLVMEVTLDGGGTVTMDLGTGKVITK